MNKIGLAIVAAILIAFAYVLISFLRLNELDYKGQAALVAVSSFSFITSAYLLKDMSVLEDDDLGKLKAERPSLVIGLIFVCVYVPISIGSSFLEVLKAPLKGVEHVSRASDLSVPESVAGNGTN